MGDDDKDIILFKVITLGDSGVGKTSIIKKFITNNFEENTMSTIGFLTSVKDMDLKNGTRIRLKLIDTAGQENFQSLAKTYIKNSDAVFFVFAHDNRESFDNINKWLTQFKDYNESINFAKSFPAYLIGNKCDLEHEIPEEEIEKMKNDNKFYGYISTSAKDDIGIQRSFEEMGEMLIKIYGKRKNKQNVKLAVKKKKNRNSCLACGPDLA